MSEQIMGMGVVIEILDNPLATDIDEVLTLLHKLDDNLSTYKSTSEIYKLNSKKLRLENASPLTKRILQLCEQSKKDTNGYFDINVEKHLDPSGLVVGFALQEAVTNLLNKKYRNFFIACGNDVYLSGLKSAQKWKVELPNPYPLKKKKRALYLTNTAISTSGQSTNGIAIYNPLRKKIVMDVLSTSVIAKNALDADRYSTAIFAMGNKGIDFLEQVEEIEGFMVFKDGKELVTSGFTKYLSAY